MSDNKKTNPKLIELVLKVNYHAYLILPKKIKNMNRTNLFTLKQIYNIILIKNKKPTQINGLVFRNN
jgi:hypothetical protein